MEAQLKEILADILDLNPEDIDGNLTAKSAAGWDSLNHLRMITVIEERYDVKLTMEEIGRMISYDSILEILNKHIQHKCGRRV